MDDNLFPMGNQGEDGSRTRANSRRQPPWQSPDPGQADYGDGYDASTPDDSYAGYDAYGHGHDGHGHDGYSDDGFGQPDGYGGPGGYPAQQSGHGSGAYPAQPGGYGSGGYPAQPDGYGGPGDHPAQQGGYGSGGYPAQPDGYGGPGDHPAQQGGYGSGSYPAQPDGYSGSGGYPAQPDGYSGSGGYPAQPDGYSGSGGYPAQRDGYGGSGGYPAQPGGSGGYPVQQGGYGSGGYPALGNGADAEDVAGRYAGNDWYGGRPAGAGTSGSGAGFADTGTYNLDARTIDAYGSGPHPAAREAADPAGLVHTGQQERYDGQYGAYSGYEGHGDYQDAPGYGPSKGFDQGFEQGGYGQGYDNRDDYAGPYQDRYGDDGTAPPAGKPGKTRKNRGGPKSGKRRLLIAATAVVVAGILAAAGYVFLLKPKPSPVTPTSAAPLPSPGSSSAATAACVKEFGQYCHIELRTDDPAPLTLAELFPPAFVNESDHGSFTRAGTKLDKTCSNAVIGQDLVSALQDGNCTQVLRASYFSGDGKMMGTIGVANLSTTNEAHHAGKLVGTSDFVDPLTTTTGVTSKLGKGTGIVEAEYKGHYLIMIWAEFTSTNAPANNTQDQQLQQFGADLIAGTANISLSQRMLNGHPATAAAS
jgi:hypothetical protein